MQLRAASGRVRDPRNVSKGPSRAALIRIAAVSCSVSILAGQERYTRDMLSRGVAGEFEAKEWQPTQPLFSCIKDYLLTEGPDFVVLAPRAGSLREEKSMTE